MESILDLLVKNTQSAAIEKGIRLLDFPKEAESIAREELQKIRDAQFAQTGKLIHNQDQILKQALARIVGFGPIQQFLDDESVEEIWCNEPNKLFIAKNGTSQLLDIPINKEQMRDIIERMLQPTGRRLDISSPFVDASLPCGSRLHVVIPDIVREFPSINIRKFKHQISNLETLVKRDSLSKAAAEFLKIAQKSKCNILVCGGTHTGKTTMLTALAACTPNDRTITIEETFELNIRGYDVVNMQCRQASFEGVGEITLRRLVKESLRMRPDRIIIGEVREAEALELLIALNSGLPGMCTIHANSAREALAKLSILPLLAAENIDASFITPTIAANIDIVIHLEIAENGKRQVSEIIAPTGVVNSGVIEASCIFKRERSGLRATGILPNKLEKYKDNKNLERLKAVIYAGANNPSYAHVGLGDSAGFCGDSGRVQRAYAEAGSLKEFYARN